MSLILRQCRNFQPIKRVHESPNLRLHVRNFLRDFFDCCQVFFVKYVIDTVRSPRVLSDSSCWEG